MMDQSLYELKELIIKLLNEVGIQPNDEDIKIIDREFPHKLKFIKGKMYIYTFQFNNDYLKIGKAGAKSKPRFYSHHYHPSRTKSNLAKSILNDTTMNHHLLTEDNISNWIKQNVRRIDIEINSNLGIFTLNLIESILHCLYKPKYEGFEKQRT